MDNNISQLNSVIKITTAVLFIALPFLSFYLGTQYQSLILQTEEDNAFIFLKPKNPTPISMSPPDLILKEASVTTDTSDWKTYKNTKYGYSLKIPKFWIDNSRDSQDEVTLSSTIKNQGVVTSISITIDKNVGTSDLESSAGNKLGSKKTINIGGMIGEQAEFFDSNTNQPKFIKSGVLYKGIAYYFTLTNPIEKVIYDQILSTFRFD